MTLKLWLVFLFMTWTCCRAQEISPSNYSTNETNLENLQFRNNYSTNDLENLQFRIEGGRVLQLINWFKKSANNENTFVGRCLGAARRLKMVMPFILFKLGVIVTTLAFISIFTMKGLGIGVLLLLLNAAGLAGKAALLKGGGYDHYQPHYIPHYHPPAPSVHVHVHKDRHEKHHQPYHYHDDGPTAFADRVSDSLRRTRTLSERLELMELYKRLGFDVDGALKSVHISQ